MRLSATAVVSVLSLALVTGCSGSGSDDTKDTGSGSGSGTQAAKALSAAELGKRILTTGDVEGYKVEPAEELAAGSKSDIEGDAKCLPLTYVIAGLAPGDAAAETNGRVTEEKKPTDAASQSLEDLDEESFTNPLDTNLTLVTLSSYDGDGAERAMRTLSEAVSGCAGGFTATSEGEDMNISKVASQQASGSGDEAVAFALTAEMDGAGEEPVTTKAQAVRHGTTIATYYTFNIASIVSAEEQPDVPVALIDAQAAKLK